MNSFPQPRHSDRDALKAVTSLVQSHLADQTPPPARTVKHFLERIFVGLALIPLSIPIGIVFLVVKLTSRGPAVFKQIRVGRGGKSFTLYKFRTMRVDAESRSGPTWSSGKNDPRLTFAGKILRHLHLDELPQLWNVVKGDMSLVGPRPERPAFVLMLSEHVDGYLDRLAVRPGITGLAQVYLEADVTIDCVRRKILFDDLYIKTGGIALDLRIALCTLIRMFGVRNGRGPKWFGLNRHCVRSGFVRPAPVVDEDFQWFEKTATPVLVFDMQTKQVMPITVPAGPVFEFGDCEEKSAAFTVRNPK